MGMARIVLLFVSGVVLLGIVVGSLHPEAPRFIQQLPWILTPHVTAYGVLALLLVLALGGSLMKTAMIVGGVFLIGVVLEIAQFWVPGRGVRMLDLVENFVGALAGATIGFILRRFLSWRP
jgi:VanZ family protein